MANLERLSNVAVIALCIVVAAKLVLDMSGSNQPSPINPRVTNAYSVGDTVATEGLDLHTATRTLLIGVRSSCVHCTASLPFYKDLRRQQLSAATAVKIVMIAVDEDAQTTRDYLARNGVGYDRLVERLPSGFRITGTPTTILVDSRGKVLKSWSGRLTERQERDLIAVITN